MPRGVAFMTVWPAHAFLHRNSKSDQKPPGIRWVYLLMLTRSLDIYYYLKAALPVNSDTATKLHEMRLSQKAAPHQPLQ